MSARAPLILRRLSRRLDFVASVAGAVASITVAAPLDVVKTRIQNANFNSRVGGMTIMREMVRQEGMGAFFKGLTPKILVVGPKLVFSYTLAQSLIPFFGKYGELHTHHRRRLGSFTDLPLLRSLKTQKLQIDAHECTIVCF